MNLQVFMFSMIFQLIPPVLLTPTNCCIHEQVVPPLPGVIGITWSHRNINLFWKNLRNTGLSFPNISIFRNMKPRYVSSYTIPGNTCRLRGVDEKTRNLLVKSLCLIKKWVWKRRNFFDLLQLIVLDIMGILLAFLYFSTYSKIWSPSNFPLLESLIIASV